jgi:Tfp pilus assembly protein FimT
MARRFTRSKSKSAGFSILELVIAVAVILILGVIVIPQAMATLRAYRLTASARAVAHQVSLARLRAETDFTNTQLVINTAVVPNTYTIQVWDKASATFQVEGGTQFLSQGISFGFGAATVPAGGQAAIQQTVQTRFNSRGIPILLDGSGNTNPNDVIYLADDQGNAYAVSVTVGGHVRVYQYVAGAWKQQ